MKRGSKQVFYDKELAFLQRVLSECNIQNNLIFPDEPIKESLDKGLRSLIGGEDAKKSFTDFFPDISPKTVYHLSDVFLMNYIFFQLPRCEKEPIFIIGPYLNAEVSHTEIFEQGEKMALSPGSIKQLQIFYSSIPQIKDEHMLFGMINSFSELIFDGNYEISDINIENSVAFIPKHFEEKHENDSGILNFQLMEERYRFENDLIEAVSQGNSHKAELMMARFSTLSFENRVADKLRNLKNYCIIMNTLLRKAAENGGVHPIYLDSVSSEFARQIESVNSLTNIPEFMLNMLRKYCLLVKKHSVKNYSPIVQKAILTIESDITGNLTLNEMAKLSNISPGYFSALFKKETGKTLTDYVNEKRINRAKHLLRTTTLQVQTVAQHCGILDFHYFCRVFKNSTGKTPTQYRNSVTFD